MDNTIATQDPPATVAKMAAPAYAQLSDEILAGYAIQVKRDLQDVTDQLNAEYRLIELELVNRITARRQVDPNARAVPSQTHIIEMVDSYTPYVFDLDKLRQARKELPADEAVKILKHVPEQITVVNAHDEAGAPVSIAALAKKYAGTEIGDLLRDSMRRSFLGSKLSIKERSK